MSKVIAGAVTSALALGVVLAGPATTAQAEPGGRFYIVNKATGTCLKGNGVNKDLSLGRCSNTEAFHWNNYGQAKYVNYSTGTVPFGVACLAANGKNGPVSLRECSTGKGVGGWQLASLNNGAQTPIANSKCGYLQAFNDKVAKCGARPANQNASTWIIKYSL
ncbi:hypothetical protein [Streptomyces sp. DH12]|uniref:hypothetical protein n=1 Tax=Streptomyces sp. DH12 TaxID=2857010 RepID=UPI001E64FB30|nr:hypothetical protein [Streptomyces sp. DH12]